MAESEDAYGGTVSRGTSDRDAGSEDKFWKRDDFRERVRRIKERENQPKAAAPEETKPKGPVFNLYGRGRGTNRDISSQPPATSTTAPVERTLKKRGGKHSSSFSQKLYEQELEKSVQTQVVKEFGSKQLPMGMTKDRFQKFIDKETQRRVEVIKQPRQVFLSSGAPFLPTQEDERKSLERVLLQGDYTPGQRRWTLFKYDMANGLNSVLKIVGEPSMWAKEQITDETSQGNVLGAVAQLGLNSAMLGVEYLKAGDYPIFASEERAKRLEEEAEIVKYTNPELAKERLAEAAQMRKGVALKEDYKKRLDVAGKAVDRAWEMLFREVDEVSTSVEENYDPNAPLGPNGAAVSPLEQAMRAEEEKFKEQTKPQAEAQAAAIRSEATTAYAQGDYQKAIELTEKAQVQDRIAMDGDPYGAYTWIREPERQAAFLKDAALVELQVGRPLTKEEIRRLKEYHQNTWTEITGELIFDPLNLVPAGVLDDAIKIPMRGLAKANKALSEAFPVYAKTIDVLGAPVRWLKRETVTSGGNRVSMKVHDLFDRVAKGNVTPEDTTKALKEVGDTVNAARAVATEGEARAIFEAAKKTTPSLEQISFREFKGLMDAGEYIDPSTWGKLYQDAMFKAHDDLEKLAVKRGVDPTEIISDASKSRRALVDVSTQFHRAYVDPHRIFKGSRLTDDTIAGWVTKTVRELSGDEINEALKLSKFDDVMLAWGKTMKPGSRQLIQATNRTLEMVLNVTGQLRDIWATAVLSTPRWIMSNLPDTAMRSVVYGGNLWDDMFTLFTSTQRTLADDLGIVPMAFSQAMARGDLDVAEDVTARLLYENWKPKAGLFSYWNYEYKRLFQGDHIAAKRDILDNMLGFMPKGKLKDSLTWLGDGFYVKAPLLTESWKGAIADFNTAIEFTFRLRMFHNEYFKLLEKIEPQFLERGLSGLSPATRELAEQIWKAAEGNPRRVSAIAESVVGKVSRDGTPAQWALTVPPEIERVTKGMTSADRNLFITSVRSSLDERVQEIIKSGKQVTGKDISSFFDEYKVKFKDEAQLRMEKAREIQGIDNVINKDGKATKPLQVNDLKGSAPVPADKAKRAELIEEVTKKINPVKKSRRTENLANDFEVAISDYLPVRRVPGEGMRVVTSGGEKYIEIGEATLKKKPTEFFNEMHQTTIQILKTTDSDVVMRAGFRNLDHYENTLRQFLDDPAAVLKENERQFLTIANQLDAHPQLRTLLERTRPATGNEISRIKYDNLMDFYREIGVYSDDFGFTRPPEKFFEAEAQRLRPAPGEHIAAAQDVAKVSADMARAERALAPEIAEKFARFREHYHVYREELKQFFAFVYPGPLMKSTKDAERHIGWEIFYRRATEEFLQEKQVKQRLIELMQSDPAAAEKYVDDALNDFGTYFLKENGIELEWDADVQQLMNIKITENGRVRNYVDPKDRALLQRIFYTPDINKKLATNPMLRLRSDARTKVQTQMRNALRDTFDIPTNRAEAWVRAIDKHADRWAKETGLPVERYYERLGFQKVEDARGLATKENTRLLKRGAVSRTPEGDFIFYGLGQSNFESMVRETAELFYDDLVSMAEHSKQAADDLKSLKSFLEKQAGGKPIRLDRLDKAHSEVMSDLFTRYVAEGMGPDIKLKPSFENYKRWLSSTYDAVKESPLAGDIPDDTRRVLDRLFVESKMEDVPRSNKRAIKLMAKEAGMPADEEELLRVINESLAPPVKLTPELQAQRDELVRLTDEVQQDLRNLKEDIASLAGEGDDRLYNQAIMSNQNELQRMEEIANGARQALDNFDLENGINQIRPYNDLGDVPLDQLKIAIKQFGDSKLAKEMSEAWEVWKTQRAMQGFPDEALASSDSFKAYLRDRMNQEWSEPAAYYNNLLWSVEQFEDAVMTHHAGKDLADAIFPRVSDVSIHDGSLSFMRQTESMMNNYESANQALDVWKKYLMDVADNGHPAMVLPKEAQAELLEWSQRASTDKAEMIDLILNGGEHLGRQYEGAVDLVNHRMIDYQHSNRFDAMMKNFFPFWKFPSRSWPFWVETMATHPQIIANYEKLQRLSRSQRYQAGAVTSRGKPLPSYDGYIKMPGTDLWFNPLAPFSFRYLLDVSKSKDDIHYEASSTEDEVEPKAWLVKQMMETGQVYGFSMAPWMQFLIKEAYSIPDDVMPSYPLLPQIPLIPRWMVADLISKADKMTLPFGLDAGDVANKAASTIYPEVPWHDSLVEKRILENTLSQIRSGKLTDKQKMKLMSDAREAIKSKGENNLWLSTYKEVTQEEWVQNTTSFFTGYRPKEFSDAQAMLLDLRNDTYLLKSAINSEFQAYIFEMSDEDETRYQDYISRGDTPEGWIYRLYTDIGWVKDDHGKLVNDPADRAKWLTIKIEQDEKQQIYYNEVSKLQDWYNETLRGLPIGASWEQTKAVYDQYSEKFDALQHLRQFEKLYGTNKSTEMIQKDIAGMWFKTVNSTRPRWDMEGGETYDQYKARVAEWEKNLPEIARTLMPKFERRRDLEATFRALKPDQQFETGAFFNSLVSMTNEQGIETWKKDNDDTFDALNKAWETLYWDDYWNSVIGKKGYGTDLAEHDFYAKHPEPPSSQEIFAWIQSYYGPDRFTFEEIDKWAGDTDSLNIEQRQLAGEENPEDKKKRNQVWDVLSWLGPGGRNSKPFEQAFQNAGGDPDMLIVWYEESGEAYRSKPEKFDAFYASVMAAAQELQLKPPGRDDLVVYIQAQEENEKFKQWVSDDLGNQFFDWTDENGKTRQGVFSYYNSLPDKQAKRDFRDMYPDEYEAIQTYYDMREVYGEENPTWNDYYGLETTPSVNIPEGQENEKGGLLPSAPSLRGYFGRGRSAGGGGGGKGQPRPARTYSPYSLPQSEGENIPAFRIQSRAGVNYSQGLLNLVGDKMAWEISQVFSSGRKISSSGVSFLRSVASRYPEYRQEVQDILARGT